MRIRSVYLGYVGQVNHRVGLEALGQYHRVKVRGEAGLPTGGNQDSPPEDAQGGRVGYDFLGTEVQEQGTDQLGVEPGGHDAYPVLGIRYRRFNSIAVGFLPGPRRAATSDDQYQPPYWVGIKP